MLRTETWVPPAAFGLLASQSWRVLQHTVDSPHLCTFTAPAEIFLDALAEELVAAHVLRFQQAQIAYIAGEWDRVLTLTNVDGQAPPPIAEAMLSAFRTGVLAGRGVDQSSQFKRLRRFWAKDGLVAKREGYIRAAYQEADHTLAYVFRRGFDDR